LSSDLPNGTRNGFLRDGCCCPSRSPVSTAFCLAFEVYD
jgi:hypothetical protein